MRFHYKNILSLISLSKTYSFQFAKKTIKNILPEPYLSITPRIDSSKTKETSFSDIQLTIIKYDRKELEKIQKETGLEKPIPCSPVLGPITVFSLNNN